MLRGAEAGTLVMADITGYTRLLAETELEHAQDALRDLTRTVVGVLQPVFRLAKLEGDAAFAYALGERMDGTHLLDTIDAAYFAFRRRLDAIARATTCQCNACIRLPGLNLKFVGHHGTFVREEMFGTEELTGTDVIVVHRLMKNSVTERTGVVAYAFLTDACLAAASLDPEAIGLVEHRESVDELPEVVGWVADLDASWRREQDRRRVRVGAEEAWATMQADLPVAPAVAWEYLTQPAQRARFIPGVQRIDEVPEAGRRGAGTRNHCIHGEGATLEEILDWRPFEYFTVESQIPGQLRFTSTTELAVGDGATHVTIRVRGSSPEDEQVMEAAGPEVLRLYEAAVVGLGELVAQEHPPSGAEAVAPSA